MFVKNNTKVMNLLQEQSQEPVNPYFLPPQYLNLVVCFKIQIFLLL